MSTRRKWRRRKPTGRLKLRSESSYLSYMFTSISLILLILLQICYGAFLLLIFQFIFLVIYIWNIEWPDAYLHAFVVLFPAELESSKRAVAEGAESWEEEERGRGPAVAQRKGCIAVWQNSWPLTSVIHLLNESTLLWLYLRRTLSLF